MLIVFNQTINLAMTRADELGVPKPEQRKKIKPKTDVPPPTSDSGSPTSIEGKPEEAVTPVPTSAIMTVSHI